MRFCLFLDVRFCSFGKCFVSIDFVGSVEVFDSLLCLVLVLLDSACIDYRALGDNVYL